MALWRISSMDSHNRFGKGRAISICCCAPTVSTRLAKQWTPILQQLSKEVGHQFLFTTATDIPTFEKRVSEGAYDLAYMNPYHFVVFNDKPGYQAVAKAKDKKIRGIIVVRKDSDIESVNQLNGQELAFPSPAAFAASILTRAYLAQRGVHFTPNTSLPMTRYTWA